LEVISAITKFKRYIAVNLEFWKVQCQLTEF